MDKRVKVSLYNTTDGNGGGVYVGQYSSFIMKGGEIKYNTTNGTSTVGGGVYVDPQATEFTKNGGIIYGYPDNKYTSTLPTALGHAVYAVNGGIGNDRYRDNTVSDADDISVSSDGTIWDGIWDIAPVW